MVRRFSAATTPSTCMYAQAAQRQTHTRIKDESPRNQLPHKGPTGDLCIEATSLVVQHGPPPTRQQRRVKLTGHSAVSTGSPEGSACTALLC